MSPTSWSLLALLSILCIALPIAAVVGWVRLRPRMLAALACAGLLVLGELAAGALVATVVNRQGQFVSTWSQVFSSGSTTGGNDLIISKTKSANIESGAAGVWKASADSSFSSRGQWPTKGRLDAVVMRGPTSTSSSNR